MNEDQKCINEAVADMARMRREPRRAQDITMKDTSSPRYKRAVRFAQGMMALLRDFLPSDRDCYRRIEDYLFVAGYESNAEVISVPPDLDAMDKLKLERHMLDVGMPKPRLAMACDAACPKCGVQAWLSGSMTCGKPECPIKWC